MDWIYPVEVSVLKKYVNVSIDEKQTHRGVSRFYTSKPGYVKTQTLISISLPRCMSSDVITN